MASNASKKDPVAGFSSERDNCRDVVLEVLEELLGNLGAYIEESCLQSRAIRVAVDSCVESVLCLVDMAYMVREDHAMHLHSPVHGSWEPDLEPEPCSIDTWIRGAIPYTQGNESKGTKPRISVSEGSLQNDVQNPGSSWPASPNIGGDSIKVAKSTQNKMINGRFKQSMVRSPRTIEVDARLRDEIASRKRQAQVNERTRKEELEAKTNLLAMKKELHGKDYAYDHNGKMIQTVKINPSNLPPAAMKPDVAVVDPPLVQKQEEDLKGTHKKIPKQKSDEVKRLTASKKAVKGRKTSPDFVEKPSESQPSALETMHMSRGVTLKQGGASKAGPSRASVPGQMNKSEYTRFIDKKKTAEAKGVQAGKVKTTESAPNADASQQRAPTSMTEGQQPAPQPMQKIPVMNTTAIPPSGHPSWLKDSKPKAEESISSEKSLNVDLYLINQSDWGQPGKKATEYQPQDVPITKPNQTVMRQTIGREERLPRTRTSQATIAPPVRPPVPRRRIRPQ